MLSHQSGRVMVSAQYLSWKLLSGMFIESSDLCLHPENYVACVPHCPIYDADCHCRCDNVPSVMLCWQAWAYSDLTGGLHDPCRSAQPVESAGSPVALRAKLEEPSVGETAALRASSNKSRSSGTLSALTAEIVECREVDEILEVVSEEAGQSLATL